MQESARKNANHFAHLILLLFVEAMVKLIQIYVPWKRKHAEKEVDLL
jgi:hypothetical protein